MVVVDLKPFQAMDGVEEIVPAGAERSRGGRNHPGCIDL
jgi:hypothetical protein